jgi:hypothetical protein
MFNPVWLQPFTTLAVVMGFAAGAIAARRMQLSARFALGIASPSTGQPQGRATGDQ